MPASSFTYRDAFDEHCFVQVPLLTLDAFRRGAEKRGLMQWTTFERAAWETLDREDLLPPVAYALDGHFHGFELTGIREGWVLVRDGVGFIPWSELKVRSDQAGGNGVYPLYSHWQYLSLSVVERHLRPSYSMRNLRDGLPAYYDALRRAATTEPDVARQRSIARDLRSRELELTRIGSVVWPVVRQGKYSAGHGDFDAADAFEFTHQEQRRLDFAAEAKRCGLDAEALKKRYEQYATQADRLDPVRDWFYLVDQLDRIRQEAVTGEALRTRDLYDAAETMRLWHAQVTGDPLPALDEPSRAINPERAKISLFGTRNIHGNREALPAILEHYGLYPWRVQLIVEGQSDTAALRKLLSEWGWTFERLGIRVMEARGSSLPKNVDHLLAEFRGYANYYLLVFDNEGNALKLVQKLLDAGVIEGASREQVSSALRAASERARKRGAPTDDERATALREERDVVRRLEEHKPGEAPEFMIWRKDMEADNFTLDEVCHVVEQHARKTIPGFVLDRSEIQNTVDTGDTALAEVVLGAAGAHDPPLRLSKKTLAEMLMQYALDHPELRGQTRPILDLAEHLIRLTGAHRELRGRLRGH